MLILHQNPDNHVLVDTHIFPSLEENTPVDFTVLNNVDSVVKAISDAEESMISGQYENAIDRVHTAIHGYFRNILAQNGIQFQQDEKINKLYNQIQTLIENEIEPAEVASLVKTTVRSASGIINTLNDSRNRHSLSHPSDSIIGKNEAKLVISMANAIVEYIGNYLNEKL
ncbi:abortive infection family protein [Weissella paramesenteroides]|uniref:abortive infection family protein n=1 Tax=Weissella paramesenteroides TaxID=1249 RepID=UPI002402C5B0|nr:abortive infection family protein [Weissella paramesenteroides]MDF8367957.1 abortive infection family protein [Weissella paramesenteroides]